MSEDTKTFQVQSAALTDRGLNERRPLNEDSFLHDQERFFSTKRFDTRLTALTWKT
jgi:hypothetical protein